MPRWLKLSLGIAGGLILALVAVTAVIVLVFDWNWARGPILKAASAAIGREVTMGALQGEWSWHPRITFQDVHFANAEWSNEPEMLSAEELAVTLDVPQLLRGRIVLPNIEVRKPRLVLERTAEGRSNWTFGAKMASDAAAPENRFEFPLIGRLTIEDGSLVYRDAKSGIDLDGEISTIVGTGGEGSSRVRVEGKGTLHGGPFTLRVLGGSLLMLRETDDPYPLTVELAIGPSQARISGSLQDPIKFEGLNLEVNLQGANLAQLSKITGVPLPLTPPYDIKARLFREDNLWLLRNISGNMGRSDIQGTLRIDVTGDRPVIDADLTSKILDYRDVGALIGIDPARYAEADAKAPNKQSQSNEASGRDRSDGRNTSSQQTKAKEPLSTNRRVLPDAKLAVDQVRNGNVRVKFRGEQVFAPNVPLSGVTLDLEIKDGVLRIKPLSVDVAGGKTIADIKIDANGEMIQTEYDIKLQNYELERFLTEAGLKDAGHGKIFGRILLSGPGDTVQKSLANARGNIRLVMYGGEISTLALELIGGDVAEALGLWAKGDKPAQILCLAADLPVESGIVKTNFFILDTSDSGVEIRGTADLAAENLDLSIVAYPKDSSPLSARTPITIRGPFAKPSVGIDPGPLATRTAGAIALGALLTPLAALLAFIDPGLEKDSDCGKLLRNANPN